MKVTNTKLRTRLGLLTLTFLFGSLVAFAQTPDLSGTYEGTEAHSEIESSPAVRHDWWRAPTIPVGPS